MKTQSLEFLPKARCEALITKEVDGELLVYDRSRDKAHCLNESAAAIWKLCDGRTTPAEIASKLGSSPTGVLPSPTSNVQSRYGATDRGSSPTPGSPTAQRRWGGTMSEGARTGYDGGIDEQIVWLGLEDLRRKHLLEEPAAWPATIKGISGMSRREVVRRIGLGAAIALPIVITITAPTPAQAGTCKHGGSTCTTGADCCSGTCQPQPPGPPRCLGG